MNGRTTPALREHLATAPPVPVPLVREDGEFTDAGQRLLSLKMKLKKRRQQLPGDRYAEIIALKAQCSEIGARLKAARQAWELEHNQPAPKTYAKGATQ